MDCSVNRARRNERKNIGLLQLTNHLFCCTIIIATQLCDVNMDDHHQFQTADDVDVGSLEEILQKSIYLCKSTSNALKYNQLLAKQARLWTVKFPFQFFF